MTTPPDEDDFTELVDFHPDRVDLVGKGANGVPRFLIAKQDANAGLLDPEFVRGLISKSEPGRSGREQVTMPNGITVSGSAADVAAFIHKASLKGAEPGDVMVTKAEAAWPRDPRDVALSKFVYDRIRKAKYNAGDLKKMAASGAAMKDGSYPIGDEDDLTKAIRAVGRGGASHDAIREHIITRAKSLGKSSLIPDDWNSDGSLKAGVSKEAGVNDRVSKDGAGDSFDDAMDDGQDGLDPTIPMGAPDDLDGIPGDPTDPGSAAWEAVDAATAVKWTTILAGGKRAVCWLQERELLEAATVDPDDAENACDLQSVLDALDYAISVLAPFAVAEQSESDGLTAEIGKAAASPLSVTGAVAAIAKAGRVLSSANEAKIRSAAQSLNDVLASLPQAPDTGGPAAVTKEEGAMPDTDEQPGTTGLGEPRTTGPADALPADGPQQPLPGDVPGRQVIKAAIAAVYDQAGRLTGVCDPAAIVQRIEKADGEKAPMQAVFDSDGELIGIVDPAAIQPVTGAGKAPDAAAASDTGAADDADADDGMTPQPAADAGTPADQVGKQAGNEDVITVSRDVLKSIAQDAAATALEAQGAAHQEVIAKMAADNGELAEELKVVKQRLETVESMPAAPRVFTNGQVPPARQLRGQDQGAQQVDVAKARERKQELYSADAPEQARIAKEMQGDAVAMLTAIHAGA